MFVINDDLSIYATRGDTVFFTIMAEENGIDYEFKAGDVIRMKIFGKKNAENVVLEKCFPVTANTKKFTILLTEEDTKIGEVISKATDYWYEIELNPFTNPQTIIGFDEDGAKIFKLFPEGADSEEPETDPEDIPVVDEELDLSSNRPVENRAIARAIVNLEAACRETEEKVIERANNTAADVIDVNNALAGERARIDNLVSGATADDAEIIDARVGADGVTYDSAGTAIRGQIIDVRNQIVYSNKDTFTYNPTKFENGNTQGWEDGSFTDYYKERIATPEIQKLPFAAVLTAGAGFRFSICLFENGNFTSDEGWLTQYVLAANQEFRLMIARVTEDENEVANIPVFASMVKFENMSKVRSEYSSVDFGFVFGSCNKNGLQLNNKRIVTKDILRLNHSITLKYNENIRIAVFTYDDAAGTNPKDHGWVTQEADYTIPGGTYFRLIVTTMTYDREVPITEKSVYDTLLYKCVDIRLTETEYSAFDNAIEISKRNTARFFINNHRQITVPQKVRSINHRGFNWDAPENTLAAYRLSQKNGFEFVECDVSWTSDNVPVLLHDDTVDRTSNGSGNIEEMTFEEVRNLDFGSWKSAEYAGEKIPTFEEFIALCRNLGLHPYIELKSTITSEQAAILIDIVKDFGMLEAVTWISFVYASLKEIQTLHESARLGLNCITTEGVGFNANHLLWMQALSNEYHNVFFNADENSIDECVATSKAHNIPLEIWCPNRAEEILAMPPYVSGMTSDYFIAHKVLFDANI